MIDFEAPEPHQGAGRLHAQSLVPEGVQRRLKIAVLTRHFTPQSGGAERYAMALVNALSARHEVHVFAQRIEHAPEHVHYHRITEPFKRPRWLNQWWYAYQTWRLTQHGFDVVHSHENTWHGQVQSVHVVPASIKFFSSRARAKGLLSWVERGWRWLGLLLSPRMMTYLWFEHKRLSPRFGKQVVSVSKSLEAQLVEHFALDRDHLSTITPAVEDASAWLGAQGFAGLTKEELKVQARARLGLDPKKIWLLWVGNDARKKGLKTLLSAMVALPEEVHLMVVGQARHADRLLKAFEGDATKPSLAHRVHRLGALSDVSMAYLASDLLVHPTLEDTFGMVVLEAMSFARPVCVSQAKFCGIAAQLKHQEEAFILDDPEDVDALIHGIEWVLSAEHYERLSQQGLLWSQTQNWEEKARALEALYSKLSQGASRPQSVNLGKSSVHGPSLSPPHRILMIKSHSMGVGDVLRSSAAWSALKAHFPGAQLHLLFLSKHPGYATESLIQEHHLLESAQFLTLREKSPQEAKAKRTPMKELIAKSLQMCIDHHIDMIIDFEMHGLRGSWLTWRLKKELARRHQKVHTTGVGQLGIKGLFYDRASPGLAAFAKSRGLTLPMDYTLRDFVALSALGIEREGRPIVLASSQVSKEKVTALLVDFETKRALKPLAQRRFLLCLNIGCGTPDALYKRPPMAELVQAMVALYQDRPFDLILTGAPFEADVNQVFINDFQKALAHGGKDQLEQGLKTHGFDRSDSHGPHHECIWIDCAGKTSLPELSALLERSDLVVSTDSGPYHMAVALKVPTLVWFIKEEVASYHQDPWCKYVVNPQASEFVQLAKELL